MMCIRRQLAESHHRRRHGLKENPEVNLGLLPVDILITRTHSADGTVRSEKLCPHIA